MLVGIFVDFVNAPVQPLKTFAKSKLCCDPLVKGQFFGVCRTNAFCATKNGLSEWVSEGWGVSPSEPRGSLGSSRFGRGKRGEDGDGAVTPSPVIGLLVGFVF